MSDIDKAVAFLNDKDAAIWSIPPELLPDHIQSRPDQAKPLIVSTERLAAVAAQLHQWEAMEQAVKFLIACQQAVLDWWTNNVRQSGRPSSPKLSQDREKVSPAQAEKIIRFNDSAISRWRKALRDPKAYERRIIADIRSKAGLEAAENHRAEGTGDNEWFTPPAYIAAARSVLGTIDLDPATHPDAQDAIGAEQFFTKDDDGLSKPWHGRVWLNPPYAQPLIGQFVTKLVDEFAAGRVVEAILLTHNYTDTAWWHLAGSAAARICFTVGRIRFIDIEGDPCAPTQGQTFFYYGPNVEDFAATFAEFGLVLCRA